MLLAVDDGIFQGNFNLADICFLIAVILFVLAAFAHWPRTGPGEPWPYGGFLVPLGLAFTACGLLVL